MNNNTYDEKNMNNMSIDSIDINEQILINFKKMLNEVNPLKDSESFKEDNGIYNFGYIKLCESEIEKNICNICEILNGIDKIDYVGFIGAYYIMFMFVAQSKNILVKHFDPRLAPSEMINDMISDTLVVAELPDALSNNIKCSFGNKKNVVVGTLYKDEELINESGLNK